ncbi:branched-chain amino acid ABC transporter permease [Lichenifustis flavocetrariae]|uniref:Branched-chain amino acid ABC transporter permease n=1 Tax=Lichenifustis flavocetrariae TaxID=2949735 RepID=A0AA41Z0F6_9HYPH|nr:branched-chain amino acid ABC transporter permease [Lichenifustis flavocetrariae]MCW6511484.1 branched-chain amino acid ABC transporter permease [Lichenifustis flavocetrariae]
MTSDAAITPMTRRPELRAVIPMALMPIAVIVFGQFLPAYPLRILDLVLLYAMLGLGLNIVVGYAGLLDLGYVAFYAIGAYTYALLASPQFDLHLPFLLVLLIGAGLAALAGVLLGIPVLRLRGDYLAIVTLGFGEIIRVLMNNLDGLTNGPQGIARIDEAVIFGWHLSTPLDYLYLLVVLVVLTFLFVWRLQESSLGIALAAVREDQDAARGCGIDTTGVKLVAFATSATIGGIGGVVFASMQQFVSPESFTFWESLSIVLVVVVGGLGNPFGVILGAALLVVMPELLRAYADYRQLLYGIALVLIILARPMGLIRREYGPSWLVRRMTRA